MSTAVLKKDDNPWGPLCNFDCMDQCVTYQKPDVCKKFCNDQCGENSSSMALMPHMQMPQMQCPHMQMHEMQMPQMQCPHMQMHEMQMPHMQCPHMQMHEMQMPHMQMQVPNEARMRASQAICNSNDTSYKAPAAYGGARYVGAYYK
jgi:hypothetical protein